MYECQREGADSDCEQGSADDVDPGIWVLVGRVRYESDCQVDQHDPHRNADQEDPAPRRLDENAAHDGTECRGSRTGRRPDAHAGLTFRSREGTDQEAEAGRGERRGADRLDDAESHQRPQ
ncbi:hypothetical protein GCM10020255_058850 [Rhodococcus baikonurensis]